MCAGEEVCFCVEAQGPELRDEDTAAPNAYDRSGAA